MEGIADFEKWVGAMRLELGQQQDIARRLAVAFVESNMRLIRHDQVARLEILKSRINKEVEGIEQMESAAQIGHAKGTLLNSGLTFAFGSLAMKAIGRKDFLKIGAQMAGAPLSRKVPFGSVLIGIGKEGIPGDIRVIPISRLARESSMSESEVETSLKHDGYLLMTPEVFAKVLEKVDSEILDGSVCLPLAKSEVMKQLTR